MANSRVMPTYEALIDSIKVKTDKTGEAECTLVLKITSGEPETEFSPLMAMLRTYCTVQLSPTQRRPMTMVD